MDETILLAVNGTLMRGMALESNMRAAGAVFTREAQTARCYRLYSIRDEYPAMLRVDPVDAGAVCVSLELWRVPFAGLAKILLGEPAGLSVGRVCLLDGQSVLGVLAEAALIGGAKEISSFGGWRAYLAARNEPAAPSV